MKIQNNTRAILLTSCLDQKGIVAKITTFLFQYNGNIIDLVQHVDSEQNIFFMRVEWELNGFRIRDKQELSHVFKREVAEKFNMNFQIHFSDEKQNMAIFVSKYSHCLYDLLARSKEWDIQIPLIISNHQDFRNIAEHFEIDFHFFEINVDNKLEQEKQQLDLLHKHEISFVVLARYMQILSNNFVETYKNKIINIHHSFLPAFMGAKPYHAAYERGVKIIGATSHYVTEDLDSGPIIAQDVTSISHKDSISDLVRKGKDLEKLVLSKAVWLHIQNRILTFNNKTIVFE